MVPVTELPCDEMRLGTCYARTEGGHEKRRRTSVLLRSVRGVKWDWSERSRPTCLRSTFFLPLSRALGF